MIEIVGINILFAIYPVLQLNIYEYLNQLKLFT